MATAHDTGPDKRFTVRVPDEPYWRDQIKCQSACPVHTDARGYVRAIAEGDYERAYLIARGPNPLASICGRICGARCEANCRRNDLDQAVSIRALKRFVTAQFGPESGTRTPMQLLKDVVSRAARHECTGAEELRSLTRWLGTGDFRQPTGDPVAIIGSGPAGLACAHDLALMGYRPTIFEMESVAAGMLYLGVPAYRLPRDLIQAEVAVIEALGVEIRCNIRVGRDVAFQDLRRDYKAVVIAVGLKKSRALPVPGHDAPEVLGGVDMLRAVALGRPVELGQRVVVVGGGNVAFDVSRTVLREEFEVGRTLLREEMEDVARTAMRQSGVREVTLCCLESLDEMPADDIEIIEGGEEGVELYPSLGPDEIHVDDAGHVTGMSFKECTRVFDEDGRFAPEFHAENRRRFDCDTVLWAIGQGLDVDFLDNEVTDIERDARGLVVCDPETQRTSAPDVWIAGDMAHGPRLMIDAIASGKRAARSIYQALSGVTIREEDLVLHFPVAGYGREDGYEKIGRTPIPTRPAEERVVGHDVEVETGFDAADAMREACRCLDCGVNTIFDGDKCILCGGCVDVCPSVCLRLVSLDKLAGDDTFAAVRDGWLEDEAAAEMSAIVKDETICIRCALCAERCPVGAITMERFTFEGAWRAAGE